MSKKQENGKVTKAAVTLAKLRWKDSTEEERVDAAKKASAGRMVKMSAEKRSEIASIAASSISAKAAHERAMKAWETRRKNAKSHAKAS